MLKRSSLSGVALVFIFLLLTGQLVFSADAGIFTCPRKLYAGTTSTGTVTAFDSSSGLPIDRDVVIWLLSSDKAEKLALAAGRTGESGVLRAEFQVPSGRSGVHYVTAEMTGLSEPLEIRTTISEGRVFLIETDKPIYKPGQKIQGRVVSLNSRLQPVEGEIEVTILDAKGIRIARLALNANEYGAAPFELQLASEVNYGVWKIRARGTSGETEKDVRVEQYVLPRFDLKLSLQKSWVLVDEPLTATVDAQYFFGQPVQGEVRVIAKRWVGTWQEYASATGVLSEGQLQFELPAVGFVAGTPADGGQGSITLDISVSDSTRHEQNLREVVKVVQAPVILAILPAHDSLKPGIPLPVIIRSESPDGEPESVPIQVRTTYQSSDGSLLDEDEVNLNSFEGTAVFELTAPKGASVAELRAVTTIGKHTTATEALIGADYSPSGRFLAVTQMSGGDPAKIGQMLTFACAGTAGATVYYEVYAGGRTIFSASTRQDQFSFVVTPDMVPKARVVAYTIGDNNEVAADSLDFQVELALSIQVDAQFGADRPRPGDPVTLTIDAGTGRRTLLGVSLVDQSVLALGRSRLHLADVFARLDQEFMEPQVEVHEGEGPGPMFRPTVQVKGALDIFNAAGLGVAVTPGLSVPAGYDVNRMFWEQVDVAVPVSAGGSSGAPDSPRVRQFFPETWLWDPGLLTDDSGKVSLDLIAPDNITQWKLAVVATAPAGLGEPGIGLGEAELTVFQDFFVEPWIPVSVTRGEEFKIKVDLFNYLEESQAIDLTLGEATGFDLLGPDRLSVSVPANSATAAFFEVRPTQVGALQVVLTGIGQRHSDAVLRQITVIPEGVPVEDVRNEVLEGGQQAEIRTATPEAAVPDSHRAFLYLTPSPVGQSMEGVSDLLGMPYGCGEQNMIFLAPDVEILRYLNELGELATDIRAKAEYYINVGYQRELTFQTDDGGFAAFGGEEGSLWLTAFVLSTFSAAREVRDIDDAVLQRAAIMIKSRQQADGSFSPDDFLIHKEMAGGLENLYTMTAFAANALADYDAVAFASVLSKAGAFLLGNDAEVAKDAYSLAVAAAALQRIPGLEPSSEQIIERLMELAIREGPLVHWKPYPVETTAYATMALLNSENPERQADAQAAVAWLATQRNALGGYGGSTQDTVTALRALFLAARQVRRNIDLQVSLLDSGYPIGTVHIDQENFDVLQQFELPVGKNALSLQASGTGTLAYQVVNRYHLPASLVPQARDLELDVTYSAEHVEADETLDVTVRVNYTGAKEKTGMVLIDVGVPTGFEVVSATLDALVERGTVQRTEIAGRKIIVYVESLTRGEPLTFAFQVRALYPVRTQTASAKAYEYYDTSVFALGGFRTQKSPRYRRGIQPGTRP